MLEPTREPPASPPPPSRAPATLAVALVSALVGGVVGGVAGAGLVERQMPPGPTAPTGAPPVGGQVTLDESSALIDSVREVLPAVVTVVNKTAAGQTQGVGSGVVIDRARGYVVTNSHVVELPRTTQPSRSFDLILSDGRKLAGAIVGNDPFTDVAVIKADGQLPAQATLGRAADAPIGARVVAIGSPAGVFQNTVTNGIVSGKGRRLPRQDLQNDIFLEDLIQTDAAINPGNSGGPLVQVSTKQVIGLNTLVFRGSGEEGLGFAVSSDTVRRIADELIQNGRVVRGFIGVSYQENDRSRASFYNLATDKGIIVLEVQPGSPGAGAGIRRLDVITKVNQQAIDETHSLATIMLGFRPGDRVTLAIVRDGRELSLELVLAAQNR